MASANPTRVGQNLLAGDVKALFQYKYLTELLAVLHTANKTEGYFMERTITNGKGAKFPVGGIAGGGFHTPGAEILGRLITASEKTINTDDMLISDVFVPSIDELMNHYDVRSNYTAEQGQFMAKVNDYYKLMLVIKAARSTANIPGETPAGSRIVDPAMKTDASKLAAAIFAAANQFDENGIPEADRAVWVPPSMLSLLVQNKDTINKLYGGKGSYADGDISAIAGMSLVKTTHIPKADFATAGTLTANVQAVFGTKTDASLIPANYQVDASTTAALVTHKGAIGTVKLAGMELEMNYDFRRKGTLIVASQVQGSGVLRPECAIELATAAI